MHDRIPSRIVPLLLAGFLVAGVLLSGCTGPAGKPAGLTRTADDAEVLMTFDGFLESASPSWEPNASVCGISTCSQQLIAENGDQAVVTLAKYPSAAEASTAFAGLKKNLDLVSLTAVPIADAGYSWQNGTWSETGFLAGQEVGVVDFRPAQGNATVEPSTRLATVLADTLA